MAEDFDARLAKDLKDDFEGLKEQLREAMTKTVSVRSTDPCDKCGCKHYRNIDVPDYRLKLQIAEWWANRGFGKPGQAAGDDQERIVFQRFVDMPPEEDA